MTTTKTFKHTAMAAALATAFGCAYADDELIKDLSSPEEAEVAFTVTNVAGERRQLGKFDDLNQSVTQGSLDSNIVKRDDATGTWLTFNSRNVGTDTAEFQLGYEKQGDWGVSAGYNQIVSNDPNTYITGVQGIGSTRLQYGNVVSSAASGAALNNALTAALYPATNVEHLGTERHITTLGLVKHFSDQLSLNVDFRHEKKDGTQLWGRGVNPEFAVQPIDSVTQQLDTVLNYTTDTWQLSGGISASRYSNDHNYVDTVGGSQYNNTAAAGAPATTNGHTFLSLPLDNQAITGFLNGGYNFTKATRATFKLAYTHATQDDSLNPITDALVASGARGTSSYIPFVPGTPSSLNGEVNTTLVELGLTSQLTKELSLVASARYQDRKDKTPLDEYANYWSFRCTGSATTRYLGNGFSRATYCTGLGLGVPNTEAQTVVENDPRDFKNTAAKLEATYRLPAGYSLTGGWNYDKRERDYETVNGEYEGVVKMRGETTEDTWRMQLRKMFDDNISGSLSYAYSDRDGSTWQPAEGLAEASYPINFLNPVPWSDRKRDKWRLVADWAPTEATSVQFNYEHNKDDYGNSKAGLDTGTTQLISLDASLALNDDWTISGWISQDKTETKQKSYTYDSRTTPSATTLVNWDCSSVPGVTIAAGCTTDLFWNMNMDDTGNALGVALRGKATEKLAVGADAQWSRHESSYSSASNVPNYWTLASAGGATNNYGQQNLPDITTTVERLSIFGQYAATKQISLRADVIYEHFKTDDWSTQVWNTAGTDLIPFQYMDGTQILRDMDQTSTMVVLRYIYKFE